MRRLDGDEDRGGTSASCLLGFCSNTASAKRACAVCREQSARGAGRGCERRRAGHGAEKNKKRGGRATRSPVRSERSPLRVAPLFREPDVPSRDAPHRSDASSCPECTLPMASGKSTWVVYRERNRTRRGFRSRPQNAVVSDGKQMKNQRTPVVDV